MKKKGTDMFLKTLKLFLRNKVVEILQVLTLMAAVFGSVGLIVSYVVGFSYCMGLYFFAEVNQSMLQIGLYLITYFQLVTLGGLSYLIFRWFRSNWRDAQRGIKHYWL